MGTISPPSLWPIRPMWQADRCPCASSDRPRPASASLAKSWVVALGVVAEVEAPVPRLSKRSTAIPWRVRWSAMDQEDLVPHDGLVTGVGTRSGQPAPPRERATAPLGPGQEFRPGRRAWALSVFKPHLLLSVGVGFHRRLRPARHRLGLAGRPSGQSQRQGLAVLGEGRLEGLTAVGQIPLHNHCPEAGRKADVIALAADVGYGPAGGLFIDAVDRAEGAVRAGLEVEGQAQLHQRYVQRPVPVAVQAGDGR